MNPTIALEPVVYFHLQTSKDESEVKITTSSSGLNLGLEIIIGRD